ncbi:MAG: ROK family transcriptional regulator [Proteobacteria bacterium]|nr:MAG: ROK family transcriptional regulator [Pseudomonadota bacterium]
MESIDSSEMRQINSNLVLKLIWQRSEISRSEIARLTGMSRSTISAIVSDLIALRLVVEEGGGQVKSGRRPINLHFQHETYSLMGIDIGLQHLTFVVSDLRGQILSKDVQPCDVSGDPESAIALIQKHADKEIEAAANAGRDVIGIGIGVPCPVHPKRMQSPMSADYLPAWKAFDLLDVMVKRYQMPIFFENDANLGALAELWWGRDRGESTNIAFVKLGAQVGAGLIIDGKIHRGSRGMTGEIGQVILNLSDKPEMIAKGSFGTVQSWIDAVIAKGVSSEDLFDEGAFFLGVGLCNLLSLLDLDEVVFGGNFPQPGERLIERMKEGVKLFGANKQDVTLSWSQLGDSQIAVGAATMVLERALNDISVFPEPRKAKPAPLVWKGGRFIHG